MQLVGADPGANAFQEQPLSGRINYFVGNDPGKWHAGVPTFGRVGFHGVYPGVDLVYYGDRQCLEYDFVVAPHADPKQIQLHFAGGQGVHVNAGGDLIVRADGRDLTWRRPTAYQQDAAGRRGVAAHFRLKTLPKGQVGVSFALGHYDSAHPLVIDPVLLYSTYLGGSGGDYGSAVMVDGNGDAYVVGYTGSADFPTTPGVLAAWFMQGTRWLGGVYFSQSPPLDYALVGTGDFRGDGVVALVLQSSSTNQIALWYTGGTDHATITGGENVDVNAPLDWKVVGVGDFNGDGYADLLFQNQTGYQGVVWFLRNGTFVGGDALSLTPPPGWKIAGPR
jgi:hypothetical protein